MSDCYGLGYKMEFDVDLMIPNQSLSINQGAIVVLGWQSANDKRALPMLFYRHYVRNISLI